MITSSPSPRNVAAAIITTQQRAAAKRAYRAESAVTAQETAQREAQQGFLLSPDNHLTDAIVVNCAFKRETDEHQAYHV
jgi:hypothetical protein